MDRQTTLSNLLLIKDGNTTHACVWLLCEDITRYTLRAGVTCALFRGTTNVHILDRKDFAGDLYTIYEDCMMYMQSKLNTALVPHARGRDELLELPEEALREALVNAIAHRDYRSTANVQVHIYSNRLDIITHGGLPAGTKKEELGKKSVPGNPLLFSLFYRMNLVEQIGSGVKSGIGIDSKGEVTPEVQRMLLVLKGEMTRREIMQAMGLSDEKHFPEHSQQTAIRFGLIEMTIPEKPSSRLQKYRLTSKGKAFLETSGERQ